MFSISSERSETFISRSYIVALLLIFMTSAPGVHGRYPRNSEGRIRDHLLNHVNFSSTDRPVLDSRDTVEVWMTLQIYAMLDLIPDKFLFLSHQNERSQVITTASWITLRWQDDRLSWNASDFDGIDIVNMFNDEIWTPKIFLSNALDYDALTIVSPDRGSVLLTSDGVASLGTPLVLSTQCPLYIRYFPFDAQGCMFQFYPENFMDGQMRLLTTESPNESAIGSREWRLVDLKNGRQTIRYYNFAPSIPVGNISLGFFCLYLQRIPSHYIQTLWVPATVLCLMTFVTFLAPPDSGERISLGVSMVLGLTVFQLLISDILPAASEEPSLLSYYLSVNFILACLAVPFSLININIAYGDSRIFILRYRWTRKLFLEYLPIVAVVPSYSQRIKIMENEGSVAHRGRRSGVRRSGSVKTPNGEGKRADGGREVENHIEQTDEDGREVGVEIDPSNKTIGGTADELSLAEKTRIELRTVALVMDRVMFAVFILVFLAFFTITIVGFKQNPGVTADVRATCG